MSSTARRAVFRALILVEAVSTLAGAVLAFVAPSLVVGSLITEPLVPLAGAMVSQASAAWTALALLLLGTLMLRPGDERALRLMLIPVLVGDLVHFGAIAFLVLRHGSWSAGAAGLVGYTLLLFAYRAALTWRPSWLLGTDRGPG